MSKEMLQEIANDEYTAADVKRVAECWGKFRYTATFLAVLQVVLRNEGDAKAADLVGTIENRMAKHEAESA